MISLMCSNSRLCMAALIFYTCVWIPYLQLKSVLLTMLGFVFPWYRDGAEKSCQAINVCLPVARFEDLKLSGGGGSSSSSGGDNSGEEVAEEEVCPICLVEFEMEDVVSQVNKCRHLFHMTCVEKWVERDHFTCPLCRSFLFANVIPSPAKCGTSDTPNTTATSTSFLPGFHSN